MRQILAFLTLFSGLSASAFAADIPRAASELSISLPGNRIVKITDYKDKVRIVCFILTT